jgi:hypothetical protein
MKVKIRKYPNYFGPYQLAELLMFWVPKDKDEYGFERTAESVDAVGAWYADTWLGEAHSWLANKYIDIMGKRRVSVHIDPWDSWSADHTLADIILPVLIDLKRSKQGAPNVDPEDVPENLRPGQLEIEQYNTNGTTDALFFKRWDWVMDEMIWAFGEHVKDWPEGDGQFHSGTHDIVWTPVDEDGNEVAKEDSKYSRMDRGPNDTSHFDKEGYEAWLNRKQNGFRLFGKYYTSLWD